MRPTVRRIIIVDAQTNVLKTEGSWIPQGKGRRSAISKSKRRKRMAIKKNRIEKGRRAVPKGSKPHS